MTYVSIGFVPLLDAAPLIMAHEMGFAAEEGLQFDLRPATSWSLLRDMLTFGTVQAAHMLAPVPVATALGLGGSHTVPVSAAAVLSVNGTVIGVSNKIADALREKHKDCQAGARHSPSRGRSGCSDGQWGHRGWHRRLRGLAR